MPQEDIILVCFKIHTKHINALCAENVEFLNAKLGCTLCNHWALKD